MADLAVLLQDRRNVPGERDGGRATRCRLMRLLRRERCALESQQRKDR